jgi:hypothetical protein
MNLKWSLAPLVVRLSHVRYLSRLIIVFLKIKPKPTSSRHSLTLQSHLIKEFIFCHWWLYLFLLPFFLTIGLRAMTLMIISTANIAEPSAASTLHPIAPSWLLHPEVALGTLLYFLPDCKLHKLLIILILLMRDLIFLTSLPTVIEHSTIQTIVLFA